MATPDSGARGVRGVGSGVRGAMNRGIRVAAAQLNFLVGDVEGNAEKIVSAVRNAARDGARLVVFPELAVTGYPPEDLLLRRDFLERTEQAVVGLATRLAEVAPGVGTVIGASRRAGSRLFNSAFYLDDGRVLAHYDKTELPNYSVFDEKRYFDAGAEACVIRIEGLRAGLVVCEDLWVEGGAATRAKAAGAEVLICLNASPFHVGKSGRRTETLRARTRETGLPILYVNQVGGQDDLVFDGDSRVVSADGETLWSAPLFEEHVHCFDLSRSEKGSCCVEHSGGLRAEIPEIEMVWRALAMGLRDYIVKNGFEGAVIGLSGGIDSALTLVLMVEALEDHGGAEQVLAVAMPSRYTADMSVEDARTLAATLGVRLEEISIEPVFGALQQQLARVFAGAPADVTEENMQARVRGALLMAIANKRRLAVIATGNKSEMAVGYATLYGDMAGAYAPLKDVVKTRVYELAAFCNRTHEVIPQRVIERSPSAELAPGQVDQDSLPPYETLDAIIEQFIEADASCADMVKRGFSADVVRRVQDLVFRNEYKRRQAPPGARITEKAFGRDRRYPMTSGFRSHPPDEAPNQ